jgi:glycerate 2-kinase
VSVLAVGKAAAAMARAAEAEIASLGPSLAVGVDGGARPARIAFRPAGHPLPDARGLRAADEAEHLARRLGPRDVLLVLLSGGASALLPAPVRGITLRDKVSVTRGLLRAGADIHELNAVRKHLSRLKGGGLTRAAAPARVTCLALSDVVGDDLSVIGSGPTVPDPTTRAEARAVLQRHGLWRDAPAAIRRQLQRGAETPKPGDALFRRARTGVIAGAGTALDAAAKEARRLGLRTLVLTRRLAGEAREVGRVLAGIVRECAADGRPLRPPACLLAAGETTVTVHGSGIGGRNLELVVAAARDLDGLPSALLASFASDGIDGVSRAAGGLVTGRTWARARTLGLAPPAAFLAENDAESFLAPLGDLIVTGPTGTNVADMVVALIGPPGARRGL